MSEIILFVQTYGQWLAAGIFALLLIVLLVNQFRLLRRVKKLQRNIDGIAAKVRDYLAVVMDSEEREPVRDARENRAVSAKGRNEEEDSRLVSSVLQEIFP